MSVFPVNRVHDILRRLEDNASQPEALKTCFGILAIMSREDTNKLLIARDGMEILLSAMSSHVDKPDVQEAGCDLLWSLSFNNNTVKDLIAKHGGATVLVRALKRHCRSADFLKSACGALSNMCQSRLNQDGVALQGGLQPLVGSIHAHQANGKLLSFVFDALASLIVSNEENARMTSSLGIIPLIVASLGRHQSTVEVVKSGCHALAILSDVKGQASKIAFAGGVAAVLPLLHLHPTYADLHRVAAVVLLRMLQESTHVSREIACHEGVRILLMSLEKGGAQQDTVAAVTHILYSVTNPSSPAASLVEAQLWQIPSSVGVQPPPNPKDDSSALNFNVTATGILKGGQPVSNATQGTATALNGLVAVLNQYMERKDVVRASCRLLNNLIGYNGIVGELNKLSVMEIVFSCVTRHHNETKDVVESAASLLRSINKRHEINIDIRRVECFDGILIVMQAKPNDDEVSGGCSEILARFLLSTQTGTVKNLGFNFNDHKVSDGRPWDVAVLSRILGSLEHFRTNEVNLIANGAPMSPSSSNTALPVVGAAPPALPETPANNSALAGGRRYQWSKQILRFVNSVLYFMESVQLLPKTPSNSPLLKQVACILEEVIPLVPLKHADIVKRIEGIVAILNPVEVVEIPNAAAVKHSAAVVLEDVDADGTVEDPIPLKLPASKSTKELATEKAAAEKSESSSATETRRVPPSRVWRYEDEDDSTGFKETNQLNLNIVRKLYPVHPLKYPVLSNGATCLVDVWPNFAERLCPVPPGSRLFAPNSNYSVERMHVVYEGASAAGKGIQSRCGNVVPYNIPAGGVGEPFEHSLTFDSEFESGNLFRAVQRGDANYDLMLRSDLNTLGHTQWFYFAVSNTHPPALVRLAEQGVQVPPVRVRFNIVNLTKPDSLFNLGMRPVVYSCWDAMISNTGWVRAGTDISYYSNNFVRNNTAGEGNACFYTLSFTLEFHNSRDTYLIAYSYPYTCSDHKLHISRLMEKPGISSILRQYRLCQSIGGNDCNLLVITNFKDAAERIWPLSMGHINGVEPWDVGKDSTTNSQSGKKRGLSSANSFGSGGAGLGVSGRQPLKPALFFSGRVHPGEPPASWMMKGMLDFLTGDTPQAQLIRQAFVIFIVPILNPDGVIFGNNRCGLAGVDLNRQWKLTNAKFHPTVYHLKSLMMAQNRMREIAMYIDLHGHSRKYNVFMYGCDHKRWSKQQVRAFPKFLSNHPIGRKYVCFEDCSFHVKKGRESTARVVVAKELNIACSYTLEATFCGSNYGPLQFCHMNIGHLQEIGYALCDAVLQFAIVTGQLNKEQANLPPNLLELMNSIQQQEATYSSMMSVTSVTAVSRGVSGSFGDDSEILSCVSYDNYKKREDSRVLPERNEQGIIRNDDGDKFSPNGMKLPLSRNFVGTKSSVAISVESVTLETCDTETQRAFEEDTVNGDTNDSTNDDNDDNSEGDEDFDEDGKDIVSPDHIVYNGHEATEDSGEASVVELGQNIARSISIQSSSDDDKDLELDGVIGGSNEADSSPNCSVSPVASKNSVKRRTSKQSKAPVKKNTNSGINSLSQGSITGKSKSSGSTSQNKKPTKKSKPKRQSVVSSSFGIALDKEEADEESGEDAGLVDSEEDLGESDFLGDLDASRSIVDSKSVVDNTKSKSTLQKTGSNVYLQSLNDNDSLSRTMEASTTTSTLVVKKQPGPALSNSSLRPASLSAIDISDSISPVPSSSSHPSSFFSSDTNTNYNSTGFVGANAMRVLQHRGSNAALSSTFSAGDGSVSGYSGTNGSLSSANSLARQSIQKKMNIPQTMSSFGQSGSNVSGETRTLSSAGSMQIYGMPHIAGTTQTQNGFVGVMTSQSTKNKS